MKLLENRARAGRLIISLGGGVKTGKTSLIFSGQSPVYFHEFDLGSLERAKPQIPASTQVYHQDYPPMAQQRSPGIALKIWNNFLAEYSASVLAASAVGGLVAIDTETILWDVMQVALLPPEDDDRGRKLGRLKYRSANGEYRGVVNYARHPDHPCDLILVHQVKPVWVRDDHGQWQDTGEKEIHSHKEVGSLADIQVLTMKPHPAARNHEFRLKIVECGLEVNLEGMVIDPSGKTPGSLKDKPSISLLRELLNLNQEAICDDDSVLHKKPQ